MKNTIVINIGFAKINIKMGVKVFDARCSNKHARRLAIVAAL